MPQTTPPGSLVIGKDAFGNAVKVAINDTGKIVDGGDHLFTLDGQVETNSGAMRSVARPTDVGAFGAYLFSAVSGNIAAGAQSAQPIFAFRYIGVTPPVALIKRVAVSLMSLGTGFTAGEGRLELVRASSFTAMDTGGTAINLTTTNNKLRSTFATSSLSNQFAMIANTAVLTAGTRTLDATPMGQAFFGVSAATFTLQCPLTDLLKRDQGASDWPLILVGNQGFVINATVPATGVWEVQVLLDWQELTAF